MTFIISFLGKIIYYAFQLQPFIIARRKHETQILVPPLVGSFYHYIVGSSVQCQRTRRHCDNNFHQYSETADTDQYKNSCSIRHS
jgi:hypothetical protein